MNKLIFWDWTGTLADESELDKAVCTSMEEELARKNATSFKQAADKYNSYLTKLENTWRWHDYVGHGQELGIDWIKCQEQNLSKLRIISGAKEILIFCRQKGYKNILATNAVKKVIQLRVEHAGLQKLFDLIIASSDAEALKSEGKHFELGFNIFGNSSDGSYSVGDNPVQDIQPALQLGLKTIFCESGRHLTHYHSEHISGNHREKIEPDFKIKTLSEIKKIIHG
jgi:FMN phosphatase YigB (HAD superfamily)